jgi:hypothetical protein
MQRCETRYSKAIGAKQEEEERRRRRINRSRKM